MVSAATARATKGEGSAVVVKCFADEVMQQMQKEAARHPFQELQVQKPCLLLHPVESKREDGPLQKSLALSPQKLIRNKTCSGW